MQASRIVCGGVSMVAMKALPRHALLLGTRSLHGAVPVAMTARPFVGTIRKFSSMTPPPSSPNTNNTSNVDYERSDKEAVKDAMAVRKADISENASLSPKAPEKIYGIPSIDTSGDYNLPHPIWHADYVESVEQTHVAPKDFVDRAALWTIQAIRFNFDWMSGWSFGEHTRAKAIVRCIFLESVAGIPGSIGGILRHLASLRRMRRDHGWIHTLFEEAENERMHLLTFITMKQPTLLFKSLVWGVQGIFFNFFFAAYLLSPRFCHRLVGYLEEQAVSTYTKILKGIDEGKGDLSKWRTTPAPEIARQYWKLAPEATMRDVIAVVRADESHHRDVNHSFAGMGATDTNPFKPGH
eukprot:TRINITY_DN1080_c0_g1_i2.p2 TRINITY_DN1080_c0_g1~~TRINITY_DN1080_c0_g1_i2.p2  ORF type:complete len:353 (-),score=82.18 TRINITY_DN1080_c0_g1_i2:1320-2378(-)